MEYFCPAHKFHVRDEAFELIHSIWISRLNQQNVKYAWATLNILTSSMAAVCSIKSLEDLAKYSILQITFILLRMSANYSIK